jgi:hypothetical protein
MDIKRNIDETDESYNRRKWFIQEIKSKNSKNIGDIVQMSNIWVNTILLKCIYPTEIMNKIKQILDKSNNK